MAVFEIQHPDGSTYEVDAPDQDTALSAFKSFAPTPSPSVPKMQGVASVMPDEGPVFAPGQTPVMPTAPTNPSAQQLAVATPLGNAAGRGAVQGVTFGFADEAAGSLGALTGGGYDASRDAYRKNDAAAEAAHPWAFGGGKLAGNVAGAAPAMMAAPGLFGLGAGAALGTRVGMGALSGGVMGAAQGLGEGEGSFGKQAWSLGTGAAGGFALGGVAPVAGQLIGRAAAPIIQRFADARAPVPGVSNQAATFLAEDFNNAGGRGAIEQRLATLGPEARLFDASPSFEGSAQGLVVRPETREMITTPVVARKQGANQRLATDLDANLGPAPQPSAIQAGIEQGQTALQPEYQRVLANAARVDNLSLAARLEQGILNTRGDAQRAMRDVRGMLDIPGVPGTLDQNPRSLLSTRQAIDGRLATETDPNTIRVLSSARAEIDGELARAVPGIKDVDGKFAELARQNEGLQRGSQVLDGGKTAIRPADLAQEITTAAQPQGTMVGPSAVPFRVQQGTRAEIDRLVGTKANDLVALKQAVKGEGDWNRAKLSQLFGPDEAGRVFASVDREAAFDAAYNRLTQNSMTELRRQAAERFAPAGERAADLTLPLSSIGGPNAMMAAAVLKGVKSASGEANRIADIGRNRDIARVLLMQPGEELSGVLGGLERRAANVGVGERRGEQARMMAEILMRSQGNEAAQASRRMISR
jgi:hypothetical protein